jgi:HEAT repeat protein
MGVQESRDRGRLIIGRIRRTGGSLLEHLGAEARPAIPQLVLALEDEELSTRRYAARALGNIGPAAKEAVPELKRMMRAPGFSRCIAAFVVWRIYVTVVVSKLPSGQ